MFTVPIELENTSDLTVYDASGNLAIEGKNYVVTNYGLPAATANAITVTWVGSTPAGTYKFYRTSDRTQPLDVSSGLQVTDLHTVFDRLTLAAQNSMISSGGDMLKRSTQRRGILFLQ